MSQEPNPLSDLRKKAEEQIHATNITDLSTLSAEEGQRLLHELQVHQIELEMQNEELRRAQDELEASRDKYSDLYDFAPVAYFTIDEKGLIEESNLTGATLLGVERRALLRQPLSRFVSQKHQDAFYLHRKETLKSPEAQHCELDLVKADGTTFFGELKSIAIEDTKTHKSRYRIAISDITKRVTAEKELQKTNNLASLGFLAGGIAHDFNNILTAIFANLQMLKTAIDTNTEAYQYVEDAWEATLRTKNLTAQLLTFATGGTPIKKAVAVEELIQKITTLSLSGSNVKPDYNFPKSLLPVNIDVGQFNRVIQNLVINAHQSMPDGGILHISAKNVTLSDQSMYKLKAGSYVKIMFTDKGIGMSEDVMRHIFDPYFTTKEAGNGLGLSIVYSIVSRHEGHITVQSEMGVGTTFELLLPTSNEQPIQTGLKENPLPTGTAKILFMDDEEIIRKTVSRILEKLGYTVDVVEDGTQALQAYQTAAETGTPYHVVIMDLTIPGGMGGQKTIQELHQKYPDAIAIVTSGYAQDTVMAEYKKYGFKGRLHKPIDLVDLTKTIEDVLTE